MSNRVAFMLNMATMMSGVNFQDMVTTMGSQSTVTATRKISRSETIHSGHFMVSEIEDNEQLAEQQIDEPSHESDYERPDEPTNQIMAYDLASECQATTQTYVYGPKFSNTVSIDGSLTKLFECMSLAYSGKITSPRWKTFKGLKLKLKDKIRLNNIIWRAWHIQCMANLFIFILFYSIFFYLISDIAGRNPVVCQFSSPIDGDSHKKPETVILEGKYWKRKLTTVTAEYSKWRMYHRKRGRPETPTRPVVS
jgi:MAX-like protein X